MSTYLGVSVRLWLLWAVFSVALGATAVGAGLFPTPPECGWTLEEGVWLEAGCSTEEELEARLAVIRAERPERYWAGSLEEAERRAECEELLAARDWDAAGCVGEWADLSAAAELLWGRDADPETGGLQ